MTVRLIGSTPLYRRAFESVTTEGGPIVLHGTYRVSAAPPLASLVTPGGTFHDVLGIDEQPVNFSATNLNAKGRRTLGPAGVVDEAFTRPGFQLYYARGVGLVVQAQPTLRIKLQLTGCHD